MPVTSINSEKGSPVPTSSAKGGNVARAEVQSITGSDDGDEADLARMGYKQEFAREFTNLSTISFAFSIMGVASSVATTFNTPFLSGGPASVVWCWFLGTFMCFCLGTSIAEIVSAYPTNGGLYSASAYLVPRKYRSIVGWVVGWLNLLGQCAGVASTEFGLAQMIATAANLGHPEWIASAGETYGIFIALLVIHGTLNSVGTKWLAKLTQSFVFINLGTVLAIIIALLVTCKEKHSASYVFTSTINGSGWSSEGLVFLLGLLSVQWTMTDYDATAHISEEVKKASIAAPVAIFVAVIGTGCVGWVYNIVYVLCSGDIAQYDGAIYAPAAIIYNNVGAKGFYVLWTGVCLTAFLVVQTALQANARTFHAFSRDHGLPDRGLFAKLAPNKIPIYGVWLVVFISALMGLLNFASYVAVAAIFSLCAIALDTSYVVPIACKLIFRDHPEVMFKPGPFTLGRGILGWTINLIAIFWTAFVVIILALPTILPVDALNMNYASVVAGGVLILSLAWYFAGGRKHYHGPRNLVQEEHDAQLSAGGAELDGAGRVH
ncbi:amino acid permease [Leucosporidium creatinivorum]|uniref:Amino acid permease n=1 Tax=Leucosporidium creatinivorum TaxID=106004 RepID=A0A1Y2FG56_9BASI|nr:amino acid permease [Leucosporidium creatinivorum]